MEDKEPTVETPVEATETAPTEEKKEDTTDYKALYYAVVKNADKKATEAKEDSAETINRLQETVKEQATKLEEILSEVQGFKDSLTTQASTVPTVDPAEAEAEAFLASVLGSQY